MIRGYVLGFSRPDKEAGHGDCELITDGKYNLLIDGYCGNSADKIISYLKKRKIKELYLALTHPHYDHYDGLRKIIKNSYFTVKTLYCYDPATLKVGLSNNIGSNAVRKDIDHLKNIISEAKAKGIKVVYLKHKDEVMLGDIKFQVFRQQPTKVKNDDNNGWSYVNDGSLCFYFYELYYWTSGDGCESIYNMIKSQKLKVKYFKIPHHGNNCNRPQAQGLKAMGADYCWYNYLEPKGTGTTDFTAYGARRCKEAGIKVFEAVGDINWIAQKGSMIIYKGGHKYTYAIKYKGATGLKAPTVNIVRGVFENKYGKGDTRFTNIIDAGYYPIAVQNKVNTVISVAKDIISGTVNFGKNEDRIKNLDNKYGAGYGQLIQDEINSLLKSKTAKW